MMAPTCFVGTGNEFIGAAAWVITVPAAALLAALIYYAIFGMVHARG
jgi:hypothetical protein